MKGPVGCGKEDFGAETANKIRRYTPCKNSDSTQIFTIFEIIMNIFSKIPIFMTCKNDILNNIKITSG